MMTEREELLRRLERVKALAERGVGGKKENAEALLMEAQVNDVNAVITRRLVCRLVLMQAESARRHICHLTVRSSLLRCDGSRQAFD